MKKRMLCLSSMIAISIISLSVLSGCSNGGEAGNSDAETDAETKEVVQLDLFSASTGSTTAAGIYDNTWWGQVLLEELNVSLNIIPTGDQAQEKLQALMAGGELPDIVIFRTTTDIQNAIRGDMLINLDEHLDGLPNVTANAPVALQYARDNLSNDTGILYTVPNAIGPADLGVEPSWGPYLRWDLYQAVGAPEINTFDDYLTVLAKMYEYEPKNADGKNNYPITLWKDWDNSSVFLATSLGPTLGIDSGDQLAQLPFLEVDFNTGETKNILDESSQYIAALRFYFEANQMGLVDPDSLTQTYATAQSKLTEGRVFFSWWSWFNSGYNTDEHTDAEPPTGFAAVLPANTKTLIPSENYTGKSTPFSIGAETKYLDECLSYIDFMYSTDGLQQIFNGPEGVIWEMNSDGKPVIMDEGWQYINDPNKELPQGGKLGDGLTVGSYGLSSAFINPTTGEPINYLLWSTTKDYMLTKQTALQRSWTEISGYQTTIDYVKANDMTMEIPLAQSLIPTMADEISSTTARIGDIVKVNSWKMIFAKDEAEFQSLYEEMVTKAEGLDMQDVYNWSLDGWEQATEMSKAYE